MLPNTKQVVPLGRRLAYLSEILISFSASPIPSHLLQTLADYTEGLISYDFFAIALVDPDEAGYIVHSLGGDSAVKIPPNLFQVDTGYIGQVIKTGKGVTIDNLSVEQRPDGEMEQFLASLSLASLLIIPVRQGGNKIGALLFMAHTPDTYNEDDQQIAMLLASGLAANLEMSRLYQTLADEQSTLKAVVESAQDGVIVVNPAGLILMANPAFHDMFNMTQQDLTGRPLLDTILNEQLHALFQQGDSHTAEITLDDGRTMQASLEPVISRYSEHIGWAAVLHDITLLKEFAQMKDEFVNTVSHDLKNPISSIMLATDMISRVGELNAMQSNMQNRIRSTATYMNELVTDLLDLGKIEAGLGLKRTQFDLIKLLDDVLFSLAANAEDKNIEFSQQTEESVTINADRSRLRQVFLNLIGNAVKYTPENGRVSVTIRTDTHIKIIIQDTGYGIPPADLPHIFDKFYRVQNEDTAHIKGTGLGLAITKSIVDAHEGVIHAESQRGVGSTFTILLPL